MDNNGEAKENFEEAAGEKKNLRAPVGDPPMPEPAKDLRSRVWRGTVRMLLASM